MPTGPQNFLNDVEYTVTAADGTTQTYTVTVMVSDPTAKSIINFKLPGQLNIALDIDHGDGADADGEIRVLMSKTANLTALTPTITHSGMAVQNTVGTTAANFSDPDNPVVYTVVAGNGSIKAYKVKITPPLLPPLSNAGAATTAGCVVTHTGSPWDESSSLKSSNLYYMLDNNLSSYGAFNSSGSITIAWSDVKPLHRVRVINQSGTILNVAVRTSTSPDVWATIATYTFPNSGGKEFVQTLPETMEVSGIRFSFTQYSQIHPRLRELILE
ncbi:MAG: DUF5018 domain-containing protein [Spirochaetaceae bacterium]|nr:DUF5018 domain-containing protein [Spirochaetaceae bacterium]